MIFSITAHIAELCSQKGVKNAIICPGSRSAPLTIAFARNKNIKSFVIIDERSAAYIGMGLAQQTKFPVALICTSGSAAYNFAPAIAEAYFQSIPLLVFTADRPNEWVEQMDGQTIFQRSLYGNHVKKFFELPNDYNHLDAKWFANRVINEAINLSKLEPVGPVHINVPLREPLYNTVNKDDNKDIRIIKMSNRKLDLTQNEWDSVYKSAHSYEKILIVVGQIELDSKLAKCIEDTCTNLWWPVTGDILSNMHTVTNFIHHSDTLLGESPNSIQDKLVPKLVITFGKSLLSKNLKLFLRRNTSIIHWHIQPEGYVGDSFQNLTNILRIQPIDFFSKLNDNGISPSKTQKEYFNLWQKSMLTLKQAHNHFFKSQKNGEFSLVNKIFKFLPKVCNLHLANSMPVRYANHIGLSPNQSQVRVYGNRGTSGIDGCTSTAVGHSLASNISNVLITGDLAFFYDRNAFWQNYCLPNLFVILLNNHGGLIFDLIKDSDNIPEKTKYFISDHQLSAENIAKEFGFSYHTQKEDIKKFFVPNGKTKLFEIESSQKQSKAIFENFLSIINNYNEQQI